MEPHFPAISSKLSVMEHLTELSKQAELTTDGFMDKHDTKIVLSRPVRRQYCCYRPLATSLVFATIAVVVLRVIIASSVKFENHSASGNSDIYLIMIAGPSVLLVSLIFFTISTSISFALTFLMSFFPWRRRLPAFLCGFGMHSIGVATAIYFIVPPFLK